MLIRRGLATIDRDVARWNGHPLGTIIVACLPMICWMVVTGNRPIDASTPTLIALLALPVMLGAIGLWRGGLYLWWKHKRVQALGAAEELERQRRH